MYMVRIEAAVDSNGTYKGIYHSDVISYFESIETAFDDITRFRPTPYQDGVICDMWRSLVMKGCAQNYIFGYPDLESMKKWWSFTDEQWMDLVDALDYRERDVRVRVYNIDTKYCDCFTSKHQVVANKCRVNMVTEMPLVVALDTNDEDIAKMCGEYACDYK